MKDRNQHLKEILFCCFLLTKELFMRSVTWLPSLLLNTRSMAARSKVPKVAFGSCQERKMFPTHSAPDRMGIELLTINSSPMLSPGCYDNHVVGTIFHNLKSRPESKKGYALAARTSPRFQTSYQTVSPSPQKYQQDWSVLRTCSSAKTPFNSSKPRFTTMSARASSNPGPGTYVIDRPRNQKVSWPMKFGSTDWSEVPMLMKRSLHTELPTDKEFKTYRSRLTYLCLYYS